MTEGSAERFAHRLTELDGIAEIRAQAAQASLRQVSDEFPGGDPLIGTLFNNVRLLERATTDSEWLRVLHDAGLSITQIYDLWLQKDEVTRTRIDQEQNINRRE